MVETFNHRPLSFWTPMEVFICYAHADHKTLTWLERYLKPLSRFHDIHAWSDRKIHAGEKWREEILSALERSQAAILLLSQDFLASDFIQSEELPRILASAIEGHRIIPILVKPCDLEIAPSLKDYQSLNPLDKPLSSMRPPVKEEYGVILAKRLRTLQTEGSIIAEVSGNESAQEEKGFLDYKEEGENALTSLNNCLSALGSESVKVTEAMKLRALAIDRANGAGDSSSSYSIVNAAAIDIGNYAKRTDECASEMETQLAIIESSFKEWLLWRREVIGLDEEAETLMTNLSSIPPNIESAIAGGRAFQETLRSLRGSSRSINRSITAADRSLERQLQLMTRVKNTCQMLEGIIGGDDSLALEAFLAEERQPLEEDSLQGIVDRVYSSLPPSVWRTYLHMTPQVQNIEANSFNNRLRMLNTKGYFEYRGERYNIQVEMNFDLDREVDSFLVTAPSIVPFASVSLSMRSDQDAKDRNVKLLKTFMQQLVQEIERKLTKQL